MAAILSFNVEEIYRDHVRTGRVVLSDAEMGRFIQYLHETDGETSLYTSDLDTRCPDIYHKIDEAAIPLMDEMDALMEDLGETGEIDPEYPYGCYRVEIELPAGWPDVKL
ncbi:MAG: hypothetical protein IKX53_02280 [Bacteroidales bacterium]|nr:hypothetical protein [Bacteroidales bacterium]